MRRSTIRQLTPIRLIITTISMLIVIGGGVVLWQNLHQSAQARSNGDTVFDLGVPSLYFGQRKLAPGWGRGAHTVFPPIYSYRRTDGEPRHQYSVDMQSLLGVPDAKLWSVWDERGSGKAIDMGDLAKFVEGLKRWQNEVLNSRQGTDNYKQYTEEFRKTQGNGVGVLNQCAQSDRTSANTIAEPPKMIPNETEFKNRRKRCEKWYTSGFTFIFYSLAGVPQTQSRNIQLYLDLIGKAENDHERLVTVQYMGPRGALRYPNSEKMKSIYGEKKLGGEVPANAMRKINTAISSDREDVVGYGEGGGDIKESVAIVVWDVSGDMPKPHWVLRLACANPIASNVGVRSVDDAVEIDGVIKNNRISQDGHNSADIEFTYRIHKAVRNFPKNKRQTVQFKFTGSRGFDHNNLVVTSANPPGIATPGGNLRFNPALMDKNVPVGTIEYKENVKVNWNSKNFDNFAGFGGGARVCRWLHASAKEGDHDFTPSEVNTLNKKAEKCFNLTVSKKGDGIYVERIAPNMTSIGNFIDPTHNGVNSWVERPKQWEDQSNRLSGSWNDCNPPDPTPDLPELTNRCMNKCRTETVRRWKEWVVVKTERTQIGSTGCTYDYPESSDCGSSSSGDRRYTCRTVGEYSRTCYTGSGPDREDYGERYNIYKIETWEELQDKQASSWHGDGTNEDNIECNVTNQESNCYCSRWSNCCSCRASLTCNYRKRRQGAQWQVTKVIHRPELSEHQLNLDEKHAYSSENPLGKPMILNSSDDPIKYYCGNTPGASTVCETQASGNAPFDTTNPPFSIAGGWNPYQSMHINATPITGGYHTRKGTPGFADVKYEVEELPTGTNICFGLSMNPWVNDGKHGTARLWAHSALKCFVVSKKPYFAVENGMVIADGGIKTIASKRGSKIISAWAEYNAVSNGSIDNLFSTNLGNFGGLGAIGGAGSNWHKLAFANVGSSGNFGGENSNEIVNSSEFFSSLGSGAYAKTQVKQHSGGDVTGSLINGINVINGDAKITGSVGGDGMVIVVKGNLTIGRDVSSINAWVIVDETLITSDQSLAAPGGKYSNVPLVFNGPVKAKAINLNRTAGSGVVPGSGGENNIRNRRFNDEFLVPAETFRDDAKFYIWSYENSVDKGRVQTVYLREVAPRY